MKIYLIRHGESTENRGDKPLPYPPLTERGQEQARLAGDALRGEGISHLYCSPMRRNLQTATRIGRELGLAPFVQVELCEYGGIWPCDFGNGAVQGTGLTRSQMRDICPDAILPDEVTETGWWFHFFPADTDELASISRLNALRVWERLKARHLEAGETVAVVGHGRSGSILLSALFGLPTDRRYPRFAQNNAGISLVEIASQQTRLVFLNRIAHLPPELVT